MDSIAESASTETKTYKEGQLIKGKDFIRLEAPLILPPNNSLETTAQDIVGAINELKKDLDEGGGGWSPPEGWPEVPEPSDYEICLLVYVDGSNFKSASVNIARPTDACTGYGSVTVDWGDGTVQSWEGYNENNEGEGWHSPLSHTYTTNGLYVVKVTTTEQSSFLYNYSYIPNWLIAKLGSEITIYGTGGGYGFGNQYRLQYVQMSGKGGLIKRSFENCYALKKVDIAIPPTVIPEHTFYNCRSLKSFDFSAMTKVESEGMARAGFTHIDMPLCTSIAAHGIQYCYNLKSINAPLCTSVGDNAFSDDYTLETVKFAEDCTFVTNCFEGCYSLYPYPEA